MTDAIVRSEPRTYTRDGDYSYFADLALSSLPLAAGDVFCRSAVERLGRHAAEILAESKKDTPEGRRISRALMNRSRSNDPSVDRRTRHEVRAVTSGFGSGGAFVVPQYLVADTVAFRTYGRSFVGQAHLQLLGDTGMTVNMPAVTAAASETTQTDTAGVSEVDPTATYLQAPVVTAAGQVTASQQLMDRQQDASADTAIYAQLLMAYNTDVDAGVIVAAIAQGAAPITNAGTLSIANTWNDVAKAQAQMVTAAGAVLPATHTFLPPLEWAWVTGQVDDTHRPIIEPKYSPTATAGDPVVLSEGDCGYVLVGSAAFRDGNIPLTGGNAQLLVCHMPSVWVFEGEPIMRAFVETDASTLSVAIQRYSYYAVIVAHQAAVQPVSGAAYPAAPVV